MRLCGLTILIAPEYPFRHRRDIGDECVLFSCGLSRQQQCSRPHSISSRFWLPGTTASKELLSAANEFFLRDSIWLQKMSAGCQKTRKEKADTGTNQLPERCMFKTIRAFRQILIRKITPDRCSPATAASLALPVD